MKKFPIPAKIPDKKAYLVNLIFLLKTSIIKVTIKAEAYKTRLEINGLNEPESLSNNPHNPKRIAAKIPNHNHLILIKSLSFSLYLNYFKPQVAQNL